MLPENEIKKISAFIFLALGDSRLSKKILNKVYARFYKLSETQDYQAFSEDFIFELVSELKKINTEVSFESFKANWFSFFDVSPENSTKLISTSYRILRDLSPDEKLSLLLKDIFSYDDSRIAKIFKTSEGTVRLRLNQSIVQLSQSREVNA